MFSLYSKRYCSNVDRREPVIWGYLIEFNLPLICSCQYQKPSAKDLSICSAHRDYMYLLRHFCSSTGPRLYGLIQRTAHLVVF